MQTCHWYWLMNGETLSDLTRKLLYYPNLLLLQGHLSLIGHNIVLKIISFKTHISVVSFFKFFTGLQKQTSATYKNFFLQIVKLVLYIKNSNMNDSTTLIILWKKINIDMSFFGGGIITWFWPQKVKMYYRKILRIPLLVHLWQEALIEYTVTRDWWFITF